MSVYTNNTCAGTPISTSSRTLVPCTSDALNATWACLTLAPTQSPVASPSSSSGSCFSALDTVRLESGQIKIMSEVTIDDRVHAYVSASKEFIYSSVIAIPHEKNDITATFTKLRTTSGKTINLTPSHLIPSGVCGSASMLPLTASKDVALGNCVMTVDGQEIVIEKEEILGKGIYTLVTMDADYIVVNDFIASPFAVNHLVANNFYNIHRIIAFMFPSLLMSSPYKNAVSFFTDAVMFITSH